MHLSKFVHSPSGKILMSIILGIGLASLFRTVCKGKSCIIFKAPPLDDINDKIYKFDNKCYTYKSSTTKCDINKKSVEYS
jgi:hypothetical protein